MSYGDTWPAPDPNELHIESTICWGDPRSESGEPYVYHMLVKGDRMLEGRYTFTSIARGWGRRR